MPITIRIKENGAYIIASEQAEEVRVEDAAGNQLLPEPGRNIALCRCGSSRRKPFCDGTHKLIGFRGMTQGPEAVGLPALPGSPPQR